MIYSKTCEYAIRALAYLASKKSGSYTMIPEIVKKTNVPGPYVAKIFQCLAKNHVLESHRGPSGGFAFKKNPTHISLREIVEAIDDLSVINDCVMGLDECSGKNPCPLHYVWAEAKKKLIKELENCYLIDLTKKVGKLQYRSFKRSRLNSRLQLTPVCA